MQLIHNECQLMYYLHKTHFERQSNRYRTHITHKLLRFVCVRANKIFIGPIKFALAETHSGAYRRISTNANYQETQRQLKYSV